MAHLSFLFCVSLQLAKVILESRGSQSKVYAVNIIFSVWVMKDLKTHKVVVPLSPMDIIMHILNDLYGLVLHCLNRKSALLTELPYFVLESTTRSHAPELHIHVLP